MQSPKTVRVYQVNALDLSLLENMWIVEPVTSESNTITSLSLSFEIWILIVIKCFVMSLGKVVEYPHVSQVLHLSWFLVNPFVYNIVF